MVFNAALGIAAGFWLLGLVAALLAIRWVFTSRPGLAAIAALAAAVIAGVGLTQFRIVASKAVNGVTQWRFDSRWFFSALLVLAVIGLAGALWKRVRAPRPA